eukprot:1181278-Rhodomonas_salina.2
MLREQRRSVLQLPWDGTRDAVRRRVAFQTRRSTRSGARQTRTRRRRSVPNARVRRHAHAVTCVLSAPGCDFFSTHMP